MPLRRSRTWSFLGVIAIVIAAGIGVGSRAGTDHPFAGAGAATLARPVSPAPLDPVMIRESDRIESALSAASTSNARHALLLAALLVGFMLKVAPAPACRTTPAGGRPSAMRLRRWVNRRGPPSSPFVSITR